MGTRAALETAPEIRHQSDNLSPAAGQYFTNCENTHIIGRILIPPKSDVPLPAQAKGRNGDRAELEPGSLSRGAGVF